MGRLKRADDDKKELMQKMQWSDKFWRDKVASLEKQCKSVEERCEDTHDECRKLRKLYQQSQIE